MLQHRKPMWSAGFQQARFQDANDASRVWVSSLQVLVLLSQLEPLP